MDIPILRYIDILIGLAVVIFLAATVVASLTQFVLWNVRWRSRKLAEAIADLVGELAPNLGEPDRVLVAERLLRHPLLKGRSAAFDSLYNRVANWYRSCGRETVPPLPNVTPAEAIERGELAMILIEWVSGDGSLAKLPDGELDAAWAARWKSLRRSLRRALKKNGLKDAEGVLRAVRFKTLENERRSPTKPASQWLDHALLDEAPSDFLGKLFASFDNAMVRSTDAFKVSAKKLAAFVALLVVVGVQLDAFALIKRLSADDALRASLVEEADTLSRRVGDDAAKDLEEVRSELTALYDARTHAFAGAPTWTWSALEPRIPGILFAWLLVSLGAPFWFDLMKNLLKLRSLVARKEEGERRARVAASAPDAGGSGAPLLRTPESKDDEAGDLSQTGAVG